MSELDNKTIVNQEIVDQNSQVDQVETPQVAEITQSSATATAIGRKKPSVLAMWQYKIESKMPPWLKKITSFVSREWLYFAAPILIFALFMGVLYAMDCYPFGDMSMSNYDLLAQIVPFFEHFYDVIDGKAGLFYSPAIAGGADVFGTLAYCSVSPFTFLFLFFGRTKVYYAVSFILPLKLACVACSAIYFLKKRFSKIADYQMLIMSIAYAFCGYMFVSNTYINWVDFLMYMPFVVLGFLKLIEEKKIRYFAIAYALMIYTCFSIACFALFMIFLIFIAYAFIACDKKDRWEVLTKMCLSLVLAVAISLPLLVPAFFAYIKSGRNTGLLENINKELERGHFYKKISYILSDTVFVFFTAVYFIKNGLKSKTNKFLLLTGVILMMPVIVDEICNLMNAGSYMSYSLRFGFLNATYTFYIASKLIASLEVKKVNKFVNAGFTLLFAVLAVLPIKVVLDINNAIIYGENASNSPLYDFSSLFAHSLGGLEVVYAIMLVLFAFFAIGSLLYCFKLASLKSVSMIILAVVAVQVAFYNIHLVRGNTFNPVRYDQYNAIFEVVDQYDDRNYYRVKDNNSSITNDAAFITHTNSWAVFSSVIDRDNFTVTNFFEYEGNKINSIECSGGTFFSDSLLGYKYFYVHLDDTRSQYSLEKKEYVVKLTETAQSYFCAYENTGVFPNCYTVDSGTLAMDSGNYFTDFDELFLFLGGKESGFVTSDFKSANVATTANKYWREVDDDGTVYYRIEFEITYPGQYYYEVDFPENQGYDVGYNTSTDTNVFEQGYYDLPGEKINLNYSTSRGSVFHLNLKSFGDKALTDEDIEKYVHGKLMPDYKVLDLSEYLKTRACEYTQKRGTFTINATAENDSTYVLLNYASIKGFKATVNGHDAEVIDNGIKFLLVKLDKGENTVVIKYTSPYYLYMIIGLLLGVAIVIALWLLMKNKATYRVLKPVVCVSAIILAVGVFAFFYAYPLVMFFKKLGVVFIDKFKDLIKIA